MIRKIGKYYLLLQLLTFTFFAQNGFKRQYYLPGSLNNTAKAVFEKNNGDLLLCGIVVDSLNGNYFNRLAIVGLNSTGEIQWVKKYGNLNFEYLDNSFIRKWFYKIDDYIYHTGCVRDSNNKYIGVLVKFNLDGDTVWQKTYRDLDTLEDVIPQGLCKSVDGGFLITGFFQNWSSNPYSKCLIIKTDKYGNELWRKKIGKSIPDTQDGKQIIQDSLTKKIVIVGYQYIGSSISWSTYDNVLICDSLGNKLSQGSYSGTFYGGILSDVIQTKDKKIVAVGSAIYPQTIGGNNMTKSYAIKFDLNNPWPFVWRINDFDTLSLINIFTGIIEKDNGDLILSGYIDKEHSKNLPFNILNRLTWINANGVVLKNQTYQYSPSIANGYIQVTQTISKGSNGSIFAALELNNNSPNPFFIVKYDSTGCDSSSNYCLTIGLNEYLNSKNNFSFFPNPASNQLTIEYNNEADFTKPKELKLIDVLGRVVKTLTIEIKTQKINIEELPNGVYYLQLQTQNGLSITKKLVKE